MTIGMAPSMTKDGNVCIIIDHKAEAEDIVHPVLHQDGKMVGTEAHNNQLRFKMQLANSTRFTHRSNGSTCSQPDVLYT